MKSLIIASLLYGQVLTSTATIECGYQRDLYAATAKCVAKLKDCKRTVAELSVKPADVITIEKETVDVSSIFAAGSVGVVIGVLGTVIVYLVGKKK